MQIFQKVKNGGHSICVSCIHRKVCKGIDNQPCIECNQFLNEDKKPQTNAGHIRAMSDEELAVFLCEPCQCSVSPTEDGYRECGNDLCKKHLVEWLKQPAEEGK